MLTEDQILEDLIKNDELIAPEDLEYIRKTDPVALHHSFGRWVRNHYDMWQIKWEPEIRDGVDYSPNHPDSISNRIITKFHEHLNKTGE